MEETDEIAPLILIPFVENAFKHGIINNPGYPVTISLKVQNRQLIFEVINEISHTEKDHSSGVGFS
jgi:two-component system LytT family sensor kinase